MGLYPQAMAGAPHPGLTPQNSGGGFGRCLAPWGSWGLLPGSSLWSCSPDISLKSKVSWVVSCAPGPSPRPGGGLRTTGDVLSYQSVKDPTEVPQLRKLASTWVQISGDSLRGSEADSGGAAAGLTA